MLRLGGAVIGTENAAEFSSVAKGEALEDTIRVVGEYVDAIVLRHPEEGAAQRAAAVSAVPIVNAGDGAGQHPTQALLDLYTIKKELGTVDSIEVAFVGDLKNGRTVRSLAYLLGKYENVTMQFVSPEALRIGADIKAYLERHSVRYAECVNLHDIIGTADVLYQTRIQKERFASAGEYNAYKDSFILTPTEVKRMKSGAIIVHPLPRVNEIAPSVDELPQAAYFKQARYGLYLRMAVLEHVLR